MKRIIYLFIFGLVLSLFLLNGCGGSGPSPQPTATPTPIITGTVTPTPMAATPTPVVYSINLTIYDKDSQQSLTGVTLSILETGQTTNITGNTSQLTLNQGQYTFYLSKSGYISKGFVFNVSANLNFSLYLGRDTNDFQYGTITGTVSDNGSTYTGSFNILAGNPLPPDLFTKSNPFSISSVCGDIVVSAYTKTGDSIDRITYQKHTLSPGNSINLSLNIPAGLTYYSGNKPSYDKLDVRQQDGYYLAQQSSSSSNYSFGVNLIPGDKILIESSRSTESYSYVTRANAGSSSGTYNLAYQSEFAYFSVNSDTNFYTFSFNSVSFANYYELYAIQFNMDTTGTQITERYIPFWVAAIDATSIKVPKNFFAPGFGTTLVYLRAVGLPGFNINTFLIESQVLNSCSYTEYCQSLNLGTQSLSSLSISRIKNLNLIRSKLKLNYLWIE